VARGADQGRLAVQRDRVSELVPAGAVRSGQLLLLAPDTTILHEYISRTCVDAACGVVPGRTHDQRARTQGQGVAERRIGCRVRGGQGLLIRPQFRIAGKDIHRPSARQGIDRVPRRRDRQRIAPQTDGGTETIVRLQPRDGQLLFQQPIRTRSGKHVRRSRVHTGHVVLRGSHG